ncbi:MAG TPA: hypothetical protein VF712_06570 [Thermoleophilaceae bacterium]
MSRRPSETSETFQAVLLTFIVTVLGVLVSEFAGLGETSYALPITIGCLAVALGALGVLTLRAYIVDLQEARVSSRLSRAIDASIPTLVRFRKREDRLTVNHDDSAQLEWEFDLAAVKDQSFRELRFLIYAEGERPQGAPWDAIKVEEVRVDDEIREGVLVPLERRLSDVPDRPSTQYALLLVPVELGVGRSTCSVRVRMTFRDVFPLAGERERFYVDVPYLTEELKVTIAAPGRKVYAAPGVKSVEAMSGLMEMDDVVESEFQSGNTRNDSADLVWETRSPKLGYRYTINFRVSEAAGSNRRRGWPRAR